MAKLYDTKTQATRAKKPGQTTRQRKSDKKWVCEWPKNRATKAE